MRQLKTKINLPTLALLTLIIAMISYQSLANREPAERQSIAIATFDLERTFNSIEEKKHKYAELVELAESFEAEREKMAKQLEELDLELKDHVEGSPKHRELLEKWSLLSHEYAANIDFYRAKLELEKGRVIKQIYLTIREAVKEMAQEHGYAVVFVDDSIAEIPLGTEQEMSRQISARRIVYSSVDITDELIARMDKAFRASRGAAAAP